MLNSSVKRGRFSGLLEKTDNKLRPKAKDQWGTFNITNGVGTTNQTFITLNNVNQGTGFNERVGSIIKMKSFNLKFGFTQTGTAQTKMDPVRVALVYDRQCDDAGALPTYDEIFKATDGQIDSWSHPNYDNLDRFVVVRDYHFTLPSAPGTTGPVAYPDTGASNKGNIVCEEIDLTGLTTVYKYGVGTYPAAFATGALYLVTQGVVAYPNNGWFIHMRCRLRYIDQ